MNISILAIGTELTTGQIMNSNSQWLAQELKRLGLATRQHLVVPDDRALIKNALDFLTAESEILFITGGLGPTEDDFTRDMVAEWAGLPMEFHAPSWEMIQNRLIARGYSVKEIQRQQCYYPRGSRVLDNSQGTANGFALELTRKQSPQPKKIYIAVLPGPPRELQAIWKDHLQELLQIWVGKFDPIETRSWDTMGVGESDVALRVNEALTNPSYESLRSKIEIGYRVHLPYVEVKVSYKMSQKQDIVALLNSIDHTLSPITFLRDGEDSADMLSIALSKHPHWTVIDDTGCDFLRKKLITRLPFGKVSPNKKAQQIWQTSQIVDPKDDRKLRGLVLRCAKSGSHQIDGTSQPLPVWEVAIDCGGQHHHTYIFGKYTSSLMNERNMQYLTELTILQWTKWLQN